MGTRGWLVFIYKGKYYILWNNNDSYPRCMGKEIVEQIFELLKRFHGDLKLACDHWGNLLQQLKIAESEEIPLGERHSFNDSHSFHDIDGSFNDQSKSVWFLQKPFESITIEVDRIFVEYVWEINLDAGSLAMWQPYSGDFKRTWPMKALFCTLLFSSDFIHWWVSDAESLEYPDDHHVRYSQAFMGQYCILLMQAHVRRFLAVRKALQPGTGLLYLAAKKRFEERSLQGGADSAQSTI